MDDMKKKKRDEGLEYDTGFDVGYLLISGLHGLWRGVTGMGRWLWRGVTGMGRWLWRLTRAALRTMWRLTAWAWRHSWGLFVMSLRWAKNVALWPFRLVGRLIFGPPEARMPEYDAYGNPNVAAIRRRVGRRYRRRGWFTVHAITFLLTNIAAWLNYYYQIDQLAPSRNYYYQSPLTMTLVWLIVLLGHIIFLWVRENEDKAVDREIARQRRASGFDEVSYQQREMRLGTDGELVEIVRDDDFDYEEKRKTQDYVR